ncbi:hypothetical protein Pcinc_019016 [Petrolisthes cinctipes]|uniref:CWF21 domain-containing protein n=1 Tax=Petrolisthes cinctipes TaxID=88211 RepID=A0AAE1FN17_PETCI|nr:hypothetical protein Pcinc_019016 [Petrolisthes cinctipes]
MKTICVSTSKMYNGIGLETARGSGTNGYVQRNLALIRNTKNKIDFRTEEELQKLEDQRTKGPNAEIREHTRKRAIELKCAEMEDVMREQGYNEGEVEEKVGVFRAMLMEREQTQASRTSLIPTDHFGRPNWCCTPCHPVPATPPTLLPTTLAETVTINTSVAVVTPHPIVLAGSQHLDCTRRSAGSVPSAPPVRVRQPQDGLEMDSIMKPPGHRALRALEARHEGGAGLARAGGVGRSTPWGQKHAQDHLKARRPRRVM